MSLGELGSSRYQPEGDERLIHSAPLRTEKIIPTPRDIGGIQSLGDFMDLTQATVGVALQDEIEEVLGTIQKRWMSRIDVDPRGQRLVPILTDNNCMTQKLLHHQCSDLDGLRRLAPEAWAALLMSSSRIQEMQLSVARSWIPHIPKAVQQQIGISEHELGLAIDIAGATMPLLNSTFLQQMHIADTESHEWPVGLTRQSTFLYPKAVGTEWAYIPFVEQFPQTWPTLVNNINGLAQQTRGMVKQSLVPPVYERLAEHLETIAEAYGSRETDSASILELWKRISESRDRVLRSECPIDILVQDAPTGLGDPFHVDPEVYIGLRTTRTREMHGRFSPFIEAAQHTRAKYANLLSQESPNVDVTLVEVVAASGSNLFWRVEGMADPKEVYCAVNHIIDTSRHTSMPILKRLFGDLSAEREQEMLSYFVDATVVHELGHTIAEPENIKIAPRIGEGVATVIIEEIKAELFGAHLVHEVSRNSNQLSQYGRDMLCVVASYSADYLLNYVSDSERGQQVYSHASRAFLDRFFAAGSLKSMDRGYYIDNIEAAYLLIGELKERVIDLYMNVATTPEAVVRFIETLGGESHYLGEREELLAFVRSL